MDLEPDTVATVIAHEDHQSSKSSTADEVSSIEALNWSDFEEDDSISQADLGLLQSIHSVMSDDSDTVIKLSTSELSVTTTTVTTSTNEDTQKSQLEAVISENEKDGVTIQKQGVKRKRYTSPKMELLAVPTNNDTCGDLSSNAAVLDDGPIWAKGSKRYKFEENRQFNQKLTFGVLLSIVLALGLGLGNLVAYNECEAEHKASIGLGQSVIQTATTPRPQILPPTNNHETLVSSDVPLATTSSESQPSKTLDSKYALHAEALSRVLKKLDELSRKIDQFENTTRQLGGIVMMRDELTVKQPPQNKPDFVQPFSERMQAKAGKRAEVKEVLEDVAGSVLESMQSNEDGLETLVGSEKSTGDELLESETKNGESLTVAPLPLKAQSDFAQESSLEFDTLNRQTLLDPSENNPKGNSKAQMGSEDKSSDERNEFIESASRKQSDLHKHMHTTKLTVEQPPTPFNLEQMMQEWQEVFKQKEREFEEEQERLKVEWERGLQAVQDFETKQKQRKNQNERQKEVRQKLWKQEEENRKKQWKQVEEESQKQRKREKDEKQKKRKQEKQNTQKRSEFDQDWDTLRAQHREASRQHASEARNSKTNWQTERSRAREQFRYFRQAN